MTTSKRRKEVGQRGYALLEYCAGAAIIAGVVWGSLGYLGNSLDGLIRGIGDWAQARATEIRNDQPTQ
jgi:hypothetical protein